MDGSMVSSIRPRVSSSHRQSRTQPCSQYSSTSIRGPGNGGVVGQSQGDDIANNLLSGTPEDNGTAEKVCHRSPLIAQSLTLHNMRNLFDLRQEQDGRYPVRAGRIVSVSSPVIPRLRQKLSSARTYNNLCRLKTAEIRATDLRLCQEFSQISIVVNLWYEECDCGQCLGA
ncbi:hypothetical protein Bbelb_122570 [Branchiostoma belcheri]|nr:hypothetical protein Bbelb_122570 [Branchiostoma belcheri]